LSAVSIELLPLPMGDRSTSHHFNLGNTIILEKARDISFSQKDQPLDGTVVSLIVLL
jgi:hypothetical protein